MDETLPDYRAITVPVPKVNVAAEDQYKALPVAEISHVVVQLSDNRMNSIMQSVVGVPYDFNKPWPFRFYISKIVSKAFFDDEEQLECLNTVRVQTSEFIAFTNNAKQSASSKLESHTDKTELRVVEVDFSKPQPGEYLRFFWKPARGIICQKVQGWLDFSSNGLQKAPPLVESTHSILTSC